MQSHYHLLFCFPLLKRHGGAAYSEPTLLTSTRSYRHLKIRLLRPGLQGCYEWEERFVGLCFFHGHPLETQHFPAISADSFVCSPSAQMLSCRIKFQDFMCFVYQDNAICSGITNCLSLLTFQAQRRNGGV